MYVILFQGMRNVIIQLSSFARDARRAGLTEEDIRHVELEIMEDPHAWPVMAGTAGLRKMRFAPESRGGGKSGGVRVCYFLVDEADHVYLVTVFAKNQKDNLSPADRNAIAAVVRYIRSKYPGES